MQFIQEGGWVMMLTMLLGFGLIVSMGFTLRRPALWRVSLVLGGLTFSSGILGAALGLIATGHFAAHVEEADVTRIIAQGMAESLNNVVLMMVFVMVSLLVGIVVALRASRAA